MISQDFLCPLSTERPLRRLRSWSSLRRLAFCLTLCGCGAGSAGGASAGRPGDRGEPYRALVIECVSAEIPRSFAAERGTQAEGAGGLFTETRDTVLSTLGLFLGTGRWAGDAVAIAPNPQPSRPGTSEECRTLGVIAAGNASAASVKALPSSEDIAIGRVAVTAIMAYDYLPITMASATGGGASDTTPPRIQVRLAVVLAQEGKVRHAESVVGRTDYARVSMGYEERPSQEVTQALTERLGEGLRRVSARLPR